MFEWEEADRFSFEDSDRFEEVTEKYSNSPDKDVSCRTDTPFVFILKLN